jgi:serine/threonine protein kinase
MSNYAIHFNEGTKGGYLLVKSLKGGMQGEATLVRSVQDGKLYVRKRMSVGGPSGLIDGVPREIYAADWLNMDSSLPSYWPRLIEYSHLKEEGRWEWSLIFQHCNGGDLEDLREEYSKLGQPVPEPLIWHIVAQVSKNLAYLHHGLQRDGSFVPNWQPFLHGDVGPPNIFLHYPPPSLSSKSDISPSFDLPEVLLGDFGRAVKASAYNDFTTRLPSLLDYESWFQDVSPIRTTIFRRLVTAHYPPGTSERDKKEVHQSFSDELKKWAEIFNMDDYSLPTTALELVETLGLIADRRIADALNGDEDFSTREWKPVRFSAPALFIEQSKGNAPELKQPWEWAKVS